MRTHADTCWTTLQIAPHAAVAWFLMASWLYYHRRVSLLSDGLYDHLSRMLTANWDFFQHPHKHLLTQADLAAGTLYRLRPDDYPTICRDTAERLYEEMMR